MPDSVVGLDVIELSMGRSPRATSAGYCPLPPARGLPRAVPRSRDRGTRRRGTQIAEHLKLVHNFLDRPGRVELSPALPDRKLPAPDKVKYSATV